MQILRLEKERHLVHRIPCLDSLEKELGPKFKGNLMSYYHLERSVWVVGRWVNKERGWVKELCILGPDCLALTPDRRERIISRLLSTYGPKEMAKDIIPLLSARKERLTEYVDSREEDRARLSRETGIPKERLIGV